MAFISGYTPSAANYGDWVEVNGSGFLNVTNVLGFATYGDTPPPYQDLVAPLSFQIVNDTLIRVRVPMVAEANNSAVGVLLQTTTGTYQHSGFTYLGVLPGTLQPTVNSFTPVAQVPGQKVTIEGQGFTGTTSVKFGTSEALFFKVVSDNLIEAYPNLTGTDLVSVTNGEGTGTKDGFMLLVTQIRLIDLPVLGRDATTDDLVYVWDIIRGILCQSTVGQLPAGSGGGGGGGDTGNVYTALGSPFKVRVDSDNYLWDAGTNSVTIQDIRLLGKSDYVVSATDLSNEFEDYNSALGTGNLEYDEDQGQVIIHNYKLTPGSHITIYADGIVSADAQSYLVSIKSKIDGYDKILKPVLTAGGTVWPWRKAANLIPAGWQECTDFRGKILIGQNPADAYDATTNPEGLSQAVGTSLGSRTHTNKIEEMVPHSHKINSTTSNLSGNGVSFNKLNNALGETQKEGGYLPSGAIDKVAKPYSILNPSRIVIWIEYVG